MWVRWVGCVWGVWGMGGVCGCFLFFCFFFLFVFLHFKTKRYRYLISILCDNLCPLIPQQEFSLNWTGIRFISSIFKSNNLNDSTTIFAHQSWQEFPTFQFNDHHERSTPLNSSSFGVNLDSSVKSRPAQQVKSTSASPGRLQFSVIIVIIKLRDRYLVNALHITKWWFLIWFEHPGNSSAVGNGEEALETDENMDGALQRSVAQKFDW